MKIVALILVFACVASFVAWRVSAVTHQRVDHTASFMIRRTRLQVNALR